MSLRRSRSHTQPLWIECGCLERARCTARAEDLDLKAIVRARQLSGDVSEGYGCARAVPVTAGRYRTNDFAVVPNGLIAAGIRIGSGNGERD
jgi:hypothetical protein